MIQIGTHMMQLQLLGRNLRRCHTKSGTNLTQLAQGLHVSRTTATRLVRVTASSKYDPKASTLFKVAEALGTDVSSLVGSDLKFD